MNPEPTAPIRKGLLPCTPPSDWEFHTWFPTPDGGGDLVPGQHARGVHIRRLVTYGEWEPVRPGRWADEPENGVRAVSAAVQPPTVAATPAHGLSVPHADALWDAVAIPGPHEATFPEQHERVCAAAAEIITEVTASTAPAVQPPADRAAFRDRISASVDEGFRLYSELEDVSLGASITDSVLTAVLATVLPEPADRAAVRAEALREAADVVRDTIAPADWNADAISCWNAGLNVAEHRLRRMAGEQPTTEARPQRGDQFEAWLKTQRNEHRDDDRGQWTTLNTLLDLYRLHADTGTPLGEHVCEGQAVGDCECLEKPAAATKARRCAHTDIVYGRCILPIPHDGECFHERQPTRVDDDTDESSLCDSEYPGDDSFVGQLCALPAGHFGEHRCDEKITGTAHRRRLRWQTGPQPLAEDA